MKTLLVAGTAHPMPGTGVTYSIYVWGQCDKTLEITFITSTCREFRGYDDMIEWARKKYMNYFQCDDFNIIHLDHLQMV